MRKSLEEAEFELFMAENYDVEKDLPYRKWEDRSLTCEQLA